MLKKNDSLTNFLPKLQLTKKGYRFITTVLRDVGTGIAIALIFALLMDEFFDLKKFSLGMGMVVFAWYIGYKVNERS